MLMETIDRAVFGACRSIEPAENHAFRRPRSKRPETRTLPSSVVAPMSSGVPQSSSPGSPPKKKGGHPAPRVPYWGRQVRSPHGGKTGAAPISSSSSCEAVTGIGRPGDWARSFGSLRSLDRGMPLSPFRAVSQVPATVRRSDPVRVPARRPRFDVGRSSR